MVTFSYHMSFNSFPTNAATHNYVNTPREYIGFEFDGLKEKDGSIYFFKIIIF